jgi:hypothetical protein
LQPRAVVHLKDIEQHGWRDIKRLSHHSCVCMCLSVLQVSGELSKQLRLT